MSGDEEDEPPPLSPEQRREQRVRFVLMGGFFAFWVGVAAWLAHSLLAGEAGTPHPW